MTTSAPFREFLHASAERRAASGSVRRIRVVYCVASMDLGGTELNALRTAGRLDTSRFDVTVATLGDEGPLRSQYDDAEIPVLHFPVTSLYNRTALREGARVFRFLRRQRIDVVHCHDMYTNVFTLPWARLARVPVIIASRRWIHSVDDARLEAANRIAYRLAHRVLGNSVAVTRLLRDSDGVRESRILHLPNFVDESAFTPPEPAEVASLRRELRLPDDAEVVGCIARLVVIKGHDILLNAFSQVARRRPRLHLVLIGDGSYRQELERLAQSLGIADRTHFAGYRPNIPNLNHLFDVAALASRSEGFPNALVEAMAAARPVVATDVGGNPDAVRPPTGILVPPVDANAFALALERLLADEPLRRSMGQAAVRVARAEYHAESVIPRLESMYSELVATSRSRDHRRP